MMKKIISAGVLLWAVYSEMSGQFITSSDTLLPGNKQYAHEISVNVTPLLAQLIGSNPLQRYEFIYKRHHTQHAFRAGIFYYKTNSNHTFTTDSSLHANFFTSEVIMGRAGYERHLNVTKRILFFYGFDLGVGFEKRYRNFEEFDSDIPVPDSSDYVQNIYHTDQAIAGFSPVLGIKIPVSRHLSFTAQTGFQMIIGVGTTVHTQRSGLFSTSSAQELVSEPYPSATFTFDAFPILNNLGFNLHF
ncbi:MAG: hypothetical protein AAF998_19310 [Bacteroidota bacterium]